MKLIYLILFVAATVTSCSSMPPIKKGCTLIGQAEDGTQLFKGCKDI